MILNLVAQNDASLFAFLRLSVSTGARRSQICGLKWADVDEGKRRLVFTRGVVDGDEGIAVKGTKSGRNYPVTMDAETAQIATTMPTAGVPVSVVAGRLGHARPATTLHVYSHFVESGDREAAALIGDILQKDGQQMDKPLEEKERPDQ